MSTQYHLSSSVFFRGKKMSSNFVNILLQKKNSFLSSQKIQNEYALKIKKLRQGKNKRYKHRELEQEDYLTLYNNDINKETPKNKLYISSSPQWTFALPVLKEKKKMYSRHNNNMKISIDCMKTNIPIDTTINMNVVPNKTKISFNCDTGRATKRGKLTQIEFHKEAFSTKETERKSKKIKLSSCAYLSISGTRFGQAKPNQDSYLIMHDIIKDNTFHIFGVMDGHGDTGKDISEETAKFFNEYYEQQSKENVYDLYSKQSYELIDTSFTKAKANIRSKAINSDYSGTTVNILYVINSKIICANLGDSRAVAFCTNKRILPLSTDHKPDLPSERERIEQCGGEVGRVNWASFGPYRVWFKGQNYPGLAMSRSLGDNLAQTIGVISTPEVKEFDIVQEDIRYVVLASDGIWEFLTNEKVRDIIEPYYQANDAKGGARRIVSEARKVWEVRNKMAIDDITVIILFFGK